MTPEERRRRAVDACKAFVSDKMHEVEGRARLMIALCPPPQFICRFAEVQDEPTYRLVVEYRGAPPS